MARHSHPDRTPQKRAPRPRQPGHTEPVANIAWPAATGKDPERQIRPAALPLIMVGSQLLERLRKLPAAPTPEHLRRTRADTEI